MRHDLVADGNGTPSLNLYQPALFYTRKRDVHFKISISCALYMDIQFTPQLLHSSTHTVLSFTKINALEKKMGYEQSLLDQPKKIIIK